jgi:hypothetical protein
VCSGCFLTVPSGRRMSLKTFFDRAAQKMSEAVSSAPKTVDGEFEAKKAMFKQFEKEFGSLFR